MLMNILFKKLKNIQEGQKTLSGYVELTNHVGSSKNEIINTSSVQKNADQSGKKEYKLLYNQLECKAPNPVT